MPTLELPTITVVDKLAVAKTMLEKCQAELASLPTDLKLHPGTRLIMQKDLAIEIQAWEYAISRLTPKEN